MSQEFLLILLAGAVSGGFISGLAGYGTSLFALGWWLQIMPPVQAVAIILLMSIVSGIQGTIAVRNSIVWRRLAGFLLPACLGIPIGAQMLQYVDAGALKLVIAIFMLAYGGYLLLRSTLPRVSRPAPFIDGTIGFFGGLLGAIAGLSGVLPTMWIAMRGWTKEQSRAVLQPFNLIVLGLSAGVLAAKGVYDPQTLIWTATALPATIFAVQAGLWTFRRMDDELFRRLLIWVTLAAGLVIAAREIWPMLVDSA